VNDHDLAAGGQPGRAAYEAYERAASGDPGYRPYPWQDVDPRGRRNWDAAAHAAIAAVDDWDHHHQAVISECEDLRDLVREILAAFDPSKGDGYRARVGQVQIARWRDRAGLEERQ
jgi:hypothetical protein